MYHDVIRITDAKKLNLDCSSVQVSMNIYFSNEKVNS